MSKMIIALVLVILIAACGGSTPTSPKAPEIRTLDTICVKIISTPTDTMPPQLACRIFPTGK